MFSRVNKIIRKVSDDEYILDKEDKWKKGLNFLQIPLDNVKVITSHHVHKENWRLGIDDNVEHLSKNINPAISSNQFIKAESSCSSIDDYIYAITQSDKDNEYKAINPKGNIQVLLKSDDGCISEGNEYFNTGVYIGKCFHLNYEPEEDCFHFELFMPKKQLDFIIKKLQSDQYSKIDLNLRIISFTWEVEDALREPFHSRTMLIDDKSLAFIESVNVTSNIERNCVSVDNWEEDEVDDEGEDDLFSNNIKQLTPEQSQHRDLLQTISSLQQPLKNAAFGICLLAFGVLANILLNIFS